jgi:lycopene beta-cyclase
VNSKEFGRRLGVVHLHYALVLLFVGLCAIGVNLGFRIKISQQRRIFAFTDAVILLIYSIWDIWAVENHNWRFDPGQILGVNLFGILPLEELLFFILVPLMTILSYLALLKITARLKGSTPR